MLLLILLTSALIIDLRASFFNMAANDSICISESLPLHARELELTNASHLWSKKEYLMMQKKEMSFVRDRKEDLNWQFGQLFLACMDFSLILHTSGNLVGMQ